MAWGKKVNMGEPIQIQPRRAKHGGGASKII